MIELTKSYIAENLLNSSGGLNGFAIKRLPDEIKDLLGNNPHEKLYLIYHNQTPTNCKFCGTPTKFAGFTLGYQDFCNNTCTREYIKNFNKTLLPYLPVEEVDSTDEINKYLSTLPENKQDSSYLNLYSLNNTNPTLLKEAKNFSIKSGASTLSEVLYLFNNNLVKVPQCAYHPCTNPTNYLTLSEGYRKYCSSDCSNKATVSQVEQTNLNNLGTRRPMQSDVYKNQYKQKMIDKYGKENYFSTEDFKKSQKDKSQTFINNRAKDLGLTFSDTFKGYWSEEGISIKHNFTCNVCNTNFMHPLYLIKNPCPTCYPNNPTTSQPEIELLEFIQQNYTGTVLTNDRTVLNGKELDIYLPDLNLAFEFNGIYWHSSLHKPKYYHQNKSEQTLSNKTDLIHIWEDDWYRNNKILKSVLRAKLGKSKRVYARDCTVRDVSYKDSTSFLKLNHIHGSFNSKYRKGLYHKEKLVAILTYSYHPNKDKWYLDRFASLLNHTIVGGVSKLLSKVHLEETYLYTYAYRDLTPNPKTSTYSKLGFEYLQSTEPNKYLRNLNTRVSWQMARRSQLLEQNPELDESKPTPELIKDLSLHTTYDSGNHLFRRLY